MTRTKAQLIEENAALRQRIAELEAPGQTDSSHDKLRLDLRERMKELACMYTIARLREKHFPSASRFLQAVADSLPASFLVPEHACARVRRGEDEYVSADFRESPFSIGSDIRVDGQVAGAVEVFYRELKSVSADAPFLDEEYALINAVADRVSRALEHMQRETDLREAHAALECEHRALQETNIALRRVMSQLEDEKRDVRSAILTNIQKIVMPIVFELELRVSGQLRSYVTLLRQNLNQVADSFLSEMCRNHVELSPVEVVISTMIRNGLSTKEIAGIRCISPATVRRHRENIRRKLGLQNRKVNLATYLQSAGADVGPSPSPDQQDQ
ncbi:MAG: helix-turn-helix transcriptional regulator [Sedimentisphaerales bacterium]|nr:helix-turn-helix transcriptional regulator [Sedimentisphaerales bacterium]